MTTEEIQASLHAYVLDEFPLARAQQLEVGDSLLDRGIIDSLGVLEIVTFIERSYGVVLSDEEMVAGNFDSIPAIARMVQSRLGTAGRCSS